VQAEIVKKGEEVRSDSIMRAEVLEAGPKVEVIKKGDIVVFAPYGVDEVVIDSEKLLIVSEELILGTYERPKTDKKAKG